MCRKGTKLEYSDEMAADLIRNYKKAIKEGCVTFDEACRKAVSMPARRFYVSEKRAYEVLSKMRKGDFSILDNMFEGRKRMFLTLYEMLDKFSRKREFQGYPLYFIVPFLISQEAPEFYISVPTMRNAMRNYKKKKRQ